MSSYEDDRRRNRYDDDDNYGRRRSSNLVASGESFLGWGTARAGLGFGLVGSVFVTIGSALLLLTILVAENAMRMGGRGDFIIIVGQVGGVLLFGGLIMFLLSLFFTGGAPTESGASGLSISIRVFIFLSLIVEILNVAEVFRENKDGVRLYLTILTVISSLAYLFWCLYLRAVASYVGASGSAGSAIALMIVALLLSGFSVVSMYEPLVDRKTFSLITFIAAIVTGLWQSILIATTRGALSTFMLKSLRQFER